MNGLSSDAICSICGQGIEYVLHAIMHCDAAKKMRLSKVLTAGLDNTVLFAMEGVPVGICSVFELELWSILDGKTLAQGRFHDRILIQTDNMKVVEVIKESFLKGSNSALIRRINQLLRNEAN
ncbi:hypothetical protein Goari_004512 [Gossypium aridum]|uniref:RNase H type-1 domain-containing protein n=1 Tax=Gossypium aridum TaxID=34290 RepID=A0A7J8Y452_GOSAI|nr:hypothetical protein [Gossypium aridum]